MKTFDDWIEDLLGVDQERKDEPNKEMVSYDMNYLAEIGEEIRYDLTVNNWPLVDYENTLT